MTVKTKQKRPRRGSLDYERHIVNRLFARLETRGGVVGDKAVLFVYNEKRPELSYILTEQI